MLHRFVARRGFATSSSSSSVRSRVVRSRSSLGLHKSPLNYTLILLPITFAGLGVWQWQRLQWKENLIKTLEESETAGAQPLPVDISQIDNETSQYRRFSVRGHFLHNKELYLRNRHRGKITGVDIITPFVREDVDGSQIILVNRGLISNAEQMQRLKDPSKGNRYTGTITIEGMLRKSETKSIAMSENHPERLEFYYVDVDAMAKVSGTSPLILYQTADDVQGASSEGIVVHTGKAKLSNRHLEYVMTWFGASAITTAFMVFYRRKIFP